LARPPPRRGGIAAAYAAGARLQHLHHYAALIVSIILSLLIVSLTDFVVKPAQASYEAARAIGEPVRRARENEILRDISAISAPLQEQGIEALRDKEATTKLLQRLIETVQHHRGRRRRRRQRLGRACCCAGRQAHRQSRAIRAISLAVGQSRRPDPARIGAGAYFVMQLFVGEPYFLVTGHAVDLRVVDYIKSIELAGKFYAQIGQAIERGQLTIFLVCAPSRS